MPPDAQNQWLSFLTEPLSTAGLEKIGSIEFKAPRSSVSCSVINRGPAQPSYTLQSTLGSTHESDCDRPRLEPRSPGCLIITFVEPSKSCDSNQVVMVPISAVFLRLV